MDDVTATTEVNSYSVEDFPYTDDCPLSGYTTENMPEDTQEEMLLYVKQIEYNSRQMIGISALFMGVLAVIFVFVILYKFIKIAL